MRRYTGHVVIGVLALSIGFTIALQAKTTDGEYKGGLVSIAQAQSLAAELNQVKDQKNAALTELRGLESKIKEIEMQESEENGFVKGMVEDLQKYKMVAGTVDVKGPGIIVTIDDPPVDPAFDSGDSVITYQSDLLLSLVNKLKDAGAEAISINSQRITSFTEISLAGNNININAVPTAPPYTVKAIGNPDTLESTINIRFGIVDVMKKEWNLQVKVAKEKELTVPRYSEAIRFRYAKPVEQP